MAPLKETLDDGDDVCSGKYWTGLSASTPFQCFLSFQGRAPNNFFDKCLKVMDFSSKEDQEPLNGSVMVDNFSLYVPANTRKSPNIDIHSITVLRLLCRKLTRSRGPIILGNP